MSPWQKFAIGSIAITLLSSSTYFQTHPGASVMAIVFATLGALGSYFWGLVSPNPFHQDDRNGSVKPGSPPKP